MELNNNLIGVQGVLVNCLKETGEFTRINYRGGNEKSILKITTELSKFLTNKGFLEEHKSREQCTNELNEIVFFLALNTVFKKTQILDEYAHLTNIIPQLSKCLLANICFGLDLVKQYGYVIEKFPLELTEELLDQMIECLRKGTPIEHLNSATVILKAVANKLSAVETSYKTEDTIEEIVKIVNIILQNILSLSSEDAKNMSKKTIYLHMGYTLMDLFELLLYINENVSSVNSFLECLLYTTSSLVKCVTINVFCAWAEVQFEHQPLQTIIAGKAYLVIEKYQKNKLASELVSMLSSIARKPKTIHELINEADISTIIKKVDEKDDNQSLWFEALLFTPIYHDDKIIDCIDRWWKLCSDSDVIRLLGLPMPSNVKERRLIIKCASNLTVESLRGVLAMHFYSHKFLWQEDIQEKLILLFNQIELDLSEDEEKEILLLIIQNARQFFIHFYTQAFKSSFKFHRVFELVRDIVEVDNVGMEMLMKVLYENPPNFQNMSNYLELIDVMITCEYFRWDCIISEILMKLLETFKKEESTLEEFCCCIKILKHFENNDCEVSREIELLQYLMICASENRCKSFLEFNSLKDEITSCCVKYILTKSDIMEIPLGRLGDLSVLGRNLDDPWTNYYKNQFTKNKDMEFIDFLLPNFNLTLYKQEKSDENFTRLLKILPRCVSTEWQILLTEIHNNCGFVVTINALTDIMILLCDITENQGRTQGDGISKMILALKLGLQSYGNFLMSAKQSTQDQIITINNVCRLMKHIPDVLKPTEGMSLIHTLRKDTLRSLAQDKEFVARIVMINDKQICKVLAQKVLGTWKR